jgi:hypothetical protein
MHVTGACHCGAITFSAEVDATKVVVCHCTDCQVLSTSAFRLGAIVLRETFAIQGDVREYRKVGSSGAERIQVFCPVCATGIYAYTPGDAGPYISLRLGPVHQRAQLAPGLQIWRRSALPWIDALGGVPGCAEQELIASMIPRQSQD